MYKQPTLATIVAEKCIGCGVCLMSCPFGLIRMEGDKAVIEGPCRGCMACTYECPQGAIVVNDEATSWR